MRTIHEHACMEGFRIASYIYAQKLLHMGENFGGVKFQQIATNEANGVERFSKS